MGATLRSRISAGFHRQDGYVRRPDGTDLGDANTYTVAAKFVWQPAESFTARLLYDYSRADENGAPLVFAAINEAATFPRVASFDAGCPGTGPAWNSVPAVPMTNDPLRQRPSGPGLANNGTAPDDQLKNWGGSQPYEATARSAQIRHRARNLCSRAIATRQHAADDPEYLLRFAGFAVEPGIAVDLSTPARPRRGRVLQTEVG
jgi:iron complex outermembrane receptor protein